MSTKTDHPDGPSILPEPELNPLLNPLLGQHMGRWAEVYFTSPPEKREQAVTELLHELQAENRYIGGRSVDLCHTGARGDAGAAYSSAFLRFPRRPPPWSAVTRAGRRIPRHTASVACAASPVVAQAARPSSDRRWRKTTSFWVASAPLGQMRSCFASAEEAVYEPVITTNELSLFQGGRQTQLPFDGRR